MATIFSPSALLSSTSTAATTPKSPLPPQPKTHLPIPPKKPFLPNLTTTLAATALATTILTTSTPPSLADSLTTYRLYYGTAASAANYGGFGGNSDKKASAEYIYEVPDGWKEKLVTKIQKGTNGTDSEFFNPKKKTEKVYLTFLDGFRKLAPKDSVLNNLALSDVDLQDLIATADNVSSEERKDDKGQVYYVYEIDGVGAHSLISVTCANNKIYAHFVKAPTPEWNRDQETLRHIHESFKTVVG
ncbi:thylakoid lumenal 19 kDa protein, chloroplastic [Primulina huaijiensis]|uniref:thylakoid lumenal 19 kDa protein, chloroplastic n=1 Tax=Primulina huaijiensis TaxID=1492673 RepID=UPI003CC6E33C